jgi:hypothetical protein
LSIELENKYKERNVLIDKIESIRKYI